MFDKFVKKMFKTSVWFLVFLLTLINGMHLAKKTNEENHKRGVYSGKKCGTNSDCTFGGTCLITPSTGNGKCYYLNVSTEKRSLAHSVGLKCQDYLDCFRLGFSFQVKCEGGVCIDKPFLTDFQDSD